MDEKLKPCPFCGRKARFAFGFDGWPNGIWCQNCRMKVQFVRIRETKKSTAWDIMEQLLTWWNQRGEA